MEVFEFAHLAPRERYKLLCAAVIPRPIAWITSIDAAGVVNAAPFSFFNVFSEDPPLVIIGMDRRADGATKDTLNNAGSAGAFTVNMADQSLAPRMVDTAAAFPRGVSEPARLGLELAAGRSTAVPRLAAAPIALECRLFELRPVGPDRHLVMGEVLALIARPGLFDAATKRIDVCGYDPVARLYGPYYARLGAPYALPIPDWKTLDTT